MIPFTPYLHVCTSLPELIHSQPRSLWQHSQAVARLAADLAEAAGYSPSEQEHIRAGSLLHDIGKQFIPASILEKDGKLSAQEYSRVQEHAWLGYSYLQSFVSDSTVLNTVLYHHECWNGTGYPFGLKGDQIPRGARICALADVWDALVSERCYRAAWSRNQAVEYIWERAGSLFDPRLACQFLNMMEAQDIRVRETPTLPSPRRDLRTFERVLLSGQRGAAL